MYGEVNSGDGQETNSPLRWAGSYNPTGSGTRYIAARLLQLGSGVSATIYTVEPLQHVQNSAVRRIFNLSKPKRNT